MRRRKFIPLKLLLAYLLFAICATRVDLAADTPVQIDYLRDAPAKSGRNCIVRLTLANQEDSPVWFLLPYWGDRPLSKNGVFSNIDFSQPFDGTQFDGKGGKVVQVSLVTSGGGGFKAFRLPAKAHVELNVYLITAPRTNINEMVVFEAQKLKVNGRTPLEKWLPYRTTSDKEVKVDEKGFLNGENLDWDAKTLRSRDDYPKEKVLDVQGEGLRKWTVKLQPKDEGRAP